jgi:hypothetical protein
MADMIDAKTAKQMLGCDDETLQGHVNSGHIRAQRTGGKLMLNKDDVAKLASSDDDGTIVLTGDSDNLSIDLGKVVDETSQTIVSDNPKDTNSGESITFGGELEVVNFDDTNTKDLSFDADKPASGGSEKLDFTTDSNTAVMTSVDESQVGATSGVEFGTEDDHEPAPPSGGARSVRSNRARVEVEPVSILWIILMAATLFFGILLITPYFFMSMWPNGGDHTKATGAAWGATETRRGVQDNLWTSFAQMAAGFSVEPNKDNFAKLHDAGDFKDINNVDSQAVWRINQYRGSLKGPNERRDSYIIDSVSDDGQTAYTAGRKLSYPVRQRQLQGTDQSVEYVDTSAVPK